MPKTAPVVNQTYSASIAVQVLFDVSFDAGSFEEALGKARKLAGEPTTYVSVPDEDISDVAGSVVGVTSITALRAAVP